MYVNVNVLQVSSCNFSPPRIYFLFATELGREHLLDKQAGNLKSVHGHMHMIVLIGERVTYLCISDFLSLINYRISWWIMHSFFKPCSGSGTKFYEDTNSFFDLHKTP